MSSAPPTISADAIARLKKKEDFPDSKVVGGAAGKEGSSSPAAALQNKTVWSNFPKDLIAGGLMGGVAHTIVAPIERAKLLLQTQESNLAIMQGRHHRYKGMIDCIFRIAKDEGVLSLWRGNGSSVMRYYPSLALNFAFKDLYRSLLISDKNDALSRAPFNFVAGAAAGCTSLVFVYPLDIAHTRLAADIGNRDARQFKGLLHFIRTIYRKDGTRGLYRGLPASIQGMVVHRSVYFGGFDTAKDLLSRDSEHLPFWKRWLMAQAATTSAGLISYPLDTVRHRMMMQAGLEKRMYVNTLDCWRKIYRMEGVSSFYRGAVSNMLRGTGAALILVLYDELKYLMNLTVPLDSGNK
ncbi:probable ADP,ATP carrier protein At5g56450 [Selaginella moellendorffii]|uniref:probable ADP,ATP carrier protein At5g56450 n=1 Tax=Selaginella moellendorffii TaxID=88036 RepID=UPI000D1D0A9C|nr:probable ADP,ATP carrier protein At5g56450 [Selaginella moellendorffii]|eukprot:XP_002967505.2 probable ADP,ATP carrier protein At5g56450 [Selaginella moellendorffii]